MLIVTNRTENATENQRKYEAVSVRVCKDIAR
jgi:hypothetical protein